MHLEKVHQIVWGDLNFDQEQHRKDLVEKQKAAKRNRDNRDNIVAADDSADEKIYESDEQLQCDLVQRISKDAEETMQCPFTGTLDEMREHYWDKHPHYCGGDHAIYPASLHCTVISTDQSIVGDDRRFDNFTVEFLKNVLPKTPAPANAIINEAANWFEVRRFNPGCDCEPFVPCSCVTKITEEYMNWLQMCEQDDPYAQQQHECIVRKSTKGRTCKTCFRPMKGHKRSNCRRPDAEIDFSLLSPKRVAVLDEGFRTPSTTAGSPSST